MKQIAYILLIGLLCTLKSTAAGSMSALNPTLSTLNSNPSTLTPNLSTLSSLLDTLTTDQKIEKYNDSILKVQSKYAEQVKARGTILDSISKISAPFNARDYIMQKRHIKKGNMNLYPQQWYEHISFGAFTGLQTIVKRGKTDVDWAIPAGLYARYEFTRLHSLRLSYLYADYNVGRRECDMVNNAVQLDYMLSLSNYFDGYNPSRIFNASVIAGIGYAHNKYKAEYKSAFLGQLGLNLALRLGSNSHVFLEPFVAFASDDIDYSAESNSHRYDINYGLKGGFNIDMYGPSEKFKCRRSMVNGQNKNSVTVSSGIALLPSNEDINLEENRISTTSVTYTRWFDDLIGIRAGGTFSTSKPDKQLLAQADIIVNALNLIPAYRNLKSPHFEWDFAFGGRTGWQWRTDLSNAMHGFAISSPILLRINSHFSFGVEPGVQWMTYTIPYSNYTNYRMRISDPSYSLTLGLRYDF